MLLAALTASVLSALFTPTEPWLVLFLWCRSSARRRCRASG
jgi:hypothetical protein